MKRPHSKIARRAGGALGPVIILCWKLGPRDARILLWRVYTGREWGLADWTGLVVLLPPPRHRTTATTTITTTTTTTYHHYHDHYHHHLPPRRYYTTATTTTSDQ